ncbi:MAG: hypothetical protein HQL32_02820 [Planctomycetes bacterium]|nr:hypothetical protein [Planctomycetota bacterium]
MLTMNTALDLNTHTPSRSEYDKYLSKVILISITLFCCIFLHKSELYATESVSLKLDKSYSHKVNPLLFGVNALYSLPGPGKGKWSPDARWQKNYLPKALKEMGGTSIRYPGGHVVSFWHWDDPWLQTYKELWDPKSHSELSKKSSRKETFSSYMDMDEYIKQCKYLKVEPIVGVNLLAPLKFGIYSKDTKHSKSLPYKGDPVLETKALLKYASRKGLEITYLYLDNEVGHQGGLPKHISYEAYPELIKDFSLRIKEDFPNVKLIINYISGLNSKHVKALVKDYGQYFDVVDKHIYYHPPGQKWGSFSRDAWMGDRNIAGYTREFPKFKAYCKSVGQDHIRTGVLEWNIGPALQSKQATSFDQLMVCSDLLMMFIQQDVLMANLWPMYWPSSPRNMIEFSPSFQYKSSFYSMELFKEIQGMNCSLLQTKEKDLSILYSKPYAPTTKSQQKKMTFIILSKNKSDIREICLDGGSLNFKNIEGFAYCEGGPKGYKKSPLKPKIEGTTLKVHIPGLSLVHLEAQL